MKLVKHRVRLLSLNAYIFSRAPTWQPRPSRVDLEQAHSEMVGKDKKNTDQLSIGTFVLTRAARAKSPLKELGNSQSDSNIPSGSAMASAPKIVIDGEEVDDSTTPTDKQASEPKKTAPTFKFSERHTELPPHLIKSHTDQRDAYQEPESVDIKGITTKQLLDFHIVKFEEEQEPPNFYHTTNALQYFRVLREMIFDWARAKSHQKNMIDSMMSDQTPPGLRIHKNLEVINSSPFLKLKALQIFSEA